MCLASRGSLVGKVVACWWVLAGSGHVDGVRAYRSITEGRSLLVSILMTAVSRLLGAE